MTNERMSRNVMCVELAMEREMAYKAKIERLKSQSHYSDEVPPLEIKGTPLNLTDVGMKRKALYNNPTYQPLACQRLREETTIREVTDDTVKRNIMPVELAIQRELANQRKMNSVRFQSHNDSKETPVPVQRLREETTIREVTDDDTVKRNIIPVELAMQRELANQRKMNSVRFQSHNDSKETPVPFQGTSSNLTDVGMKRQAPYGYPTGKLPQKLQSSVGQQDLVIQSQPPVNLYCKICHVFCPGSFNYKQHCRGRKHNANLQQMNSPRNGGETAGWPFWCDICMVPCMNEDCFRMHLAGKKHASCAQAVKNAGVLGN